MSADPQELSQQVAQLSAEVIRPYPGSRKIQVTGPSGLQVAMREVQQTPSHTAQGPQPNEPLALYDTSGPYTDPQALVDLNQGLVPMRQAWIEARGDTQLLPGVSSDYGRLRQQDSRLAALRFTCNRPPRRAQTGANVTQMHYARRGLVTPEMEYIAIRENQRLQEIQDAALRAAIPARPSARGCPS